MEVGKPLRVHRVEPLKNPVPRQKPRKAPRSPERERPQPIPSR
jgi:hypothetical protein